MSFAEIRDQQVAVRLMQNMIARNRAPHGLLFHGPGGVGKELAAREFAKAVNCLDSRADACGACLSCQKIDHGTHPDIRHITSSGKRREIPMDSIRMINELAVYRPFEGRRRVILIHDADRMWPDTQNHFLKTLEEPPSATIFILMTENPRRLLPTIRSRCQQVRFGALRPETVVDLLLRDRDLPPAVARTIAALSGGQMSRAVDMVESERRTIVTDLTTRMARGEDPLLLADEFAKHLKSQQDVIETSVKAEFKEAERENPEMQEDREESEKAQKAVAAALVRRELTEYLYLFASWYRDELTMKVTGNPDLLLNQDMQDKFQAQGEGNASKLEAIEKAWLYIERNIFRERVFRDLFFVLSRP